MAIPATPTSFFVQTANSQNLISFALATGATSYDIQRSVDGVTYSSIATPATNQYLDTSVSRGTQYWYKAASVNGSGTSPYTIPQSVVPVLTGEMCLSQIRLQAQQRADRVNSQFLTMPEWNININQSLFELYDLLVTTYEDYFLASPVSFQTNGSTYLYPLPDGILYNGAEPFYKLMGVDLALNTAQNAFVTINKFNFIDRNSYLYPNSASTIYGVFNMRYRVLGSQIEFIPTPTGSQTIRLWYIPRLRQLLLDTDTTADSVSGWIEYVIVDAAIKALQKEESDVSVLMAQKMALIKRIEETAMNRDAGIPDTISNARSNNWGSGWGGGWNGPIGGW